MILYGASGHARVILDILESQGVIPEYIVDDNPTVTELQGVEVRRNTGKYNTLLISIGSNEIRKKTVGKIEVTQYAKAIDKTAVVSKFAHIGAGTVVMQGAIVQSGATIGKHCIINTAATVDHECRIADYVHLSPHATLCGNVTVGEGSWIGAGAVVIQGVKIGKWSVIGAGSVVTEDIPDNVIAVGNKCNVIKHR